MSYVSRGDFCGRGKQHKLKNDLHYDYKTHEDCMEHELYPSTTQTIF